jgi:hypothetical protein
MSQIENKYVGILTDIYNKLGYKSLQKQFPIGKYESGYTDHLKTTNRRDRTVDLKAELKIDGMPCICMNEIDGAHDDFYKYREMVLHFNSTATDEQIVSMYNDMACKDVWQVKHCYDEFGAYTIRIKTPENNKEEQLLDKFLTKTNIQKVIRTIRKNDALGAIIRRNKFELIKEPLIAHTVTLSEINEKEISSNSN